MSLVLCPHECDCSCHTDGSIHVVPCCEGLCIAGCGKYIKVGQMDAHLQECHPTEGKVYFFPRAMQVHMDEARKSKLRDLRKNIKRAELTGKVTPEIERFRALLRKLCPHLPKYVFQGPRGGWPNTYTRTCASCGTMETACDLESFLVLKHSSREASREECERMKSLDIMTLKEIDPDLL